MNTAENNSKQSADAEMIPEKPNHEQTTFTDFNMCIKDPITPRIKPLEDLYKDIPDFLLSPAVELKQEKSGLDDWDLDGDTTGSNDPKDCKSTEKEEEKIEARSLKVPQSLSKTKTPLPTSQKFSIRKHLKTSHFSK